MRKLPDKPPVLEETALGTVHQYTLDQMNQYGMDCARFALQEAMLMVSNYGENPRFYLEENVVNHIETAKGNIECRLMNIRDNLTYEAEAK